MSNIFIAGSIAIPQLADAVTARIDNMLTNQLAILVGDANGVDLAVQRFLAQRQYPAVRVYCSGERARNNVGHWPLRCVHAPHARGTRGFFAEKDRVMAREADYGLMIWDMQSTGTLNNVLTLTAQAKKCVVYLHPEQQFVTISDAASCQQLADRMTPAARARAGQKIKLEQQLAALAGGTGLI